MSEDGKRSVGTCHYDSQSSRGVRPIASRSRTQKKELDLETTRRQAAEVDAGGLMRYGINFEEQ
jgi:hypothetical protein